MKHSVTIEIMQSREMTATPTAERVLNELIKNIDSMRTDMIFVHTQVSLEKLSNLIKDHFQDGISIREGCLEGCYGATTGKTLNGITLHVNAEEFPERSEYGEDKNEYEEWFNPVVSIKNSNCKILDLDEDAIEKIMENFESCEDIKIEHDNSYNHSGNNETVTPLYDFDFKVVDDGNLIWVAIRFHFGGDIRGNYSREYMFTCENIEDLYEALMPSWYGPVEGN